jgi:hypothetical protein
MVILTVIIVAVAFALSLAHALELPGKMRLDKETYYAVQPIYYPGFTIGGASEPFGTILTIILLFLTPLGGADFWLTLVALLGLLGMQAVYWLFTHPVNKFWVEGESLDRLSSGLFHSGQIREEPVQRTGQSCETAGNIRMWRARDVHS